MSGTAFAVAMASVREAHGKGFEEGERSVWTGLIRYAMNGLRASGGQVAIDAPAVVQLAEAEMQLRQLFEDLQLEWPEGVHLGDVIEKHLVPALLEDES